MALIYGTPFDDSLNGTAGNDEIIGFAGDDTLYGHDSNDSLAGSEGDDFLDGGAGDDYLLGDTGDDFLDGADGNDVVIGGYGNDSLNGGDGNDSMNGGAGDDTMDGDSLNGGTGDDRLDGGIGFDTMDGGDGGDTYVVDHPLDVVIDLGSTSDIDTIQSSITYTLGGTLERLTLTGSSAINGTGNTLANMLFGNDTDNVLSGLAGDDELYGEAGDDVLNGGAGADSMEGGAGNDTYIVDNLLDTVIDLGPSSESDTVQSSLSYTLGGTIEHLTLTGSSAINGTGNALNNTLTGNGAANILSGLDGNDRLTGGAGNDTLLGGNGNDVLTGGSGRDQLNGGAGNDRFDFNATSESPTSTGRDVITGFAGAGTALGDQIDLRDIDANTLVSGNQAFTWKGATPGGAGTLWYTGGVLYGNVDGDATPEFQIQLVGTPTLSVGGTGTDILL